MSRAAFIGCCMLASASQAQLLTDNGATIHVASGAQLSVNGSVLAQGAAWIDNVGVIDLSGDLTNNSTGPLFTVAPGTVVMDGTAQMIGGVAGTEFNDLDLQCATLALQQDIQVGGTIALANGVLQLGAATMQLNSHRITVLNTAPSAITRTTGHIVSETDPLAGYGEVAWRVDNSTGSYVIPFGTGSAYLPVTLDVTTAATGLWSFVMATYPTDPFATPNNRPLPNGLPSLTDIAGVENAPNVVDRFWPLLTTSSGTPPAATLTFTYQDAEWNSGTNAILESALQAQHFDGAVWSQPPNGLVDPAMNSVTTAPTSSFDLVWALVQGFTPLPVELLMFTARPENDAVVCEWRTASEVGNDFFTVERSVDGLSFTDIGEVDGAGNSQTTLEYAFTDGAPLSGLSYYRLRQTDLDGTETWSDMVAVWRDALSAELMVYPNPCRNELFVAGAWQGDAHVAVLDAMGRMVADLGLLRNGRVDLSALATGAYSLQVMEAGVVRTARFMKH